MRNFRYTAFAIVAVSAVFCTVAFYSYIFQLDPNLCMNWDAHPTTRLLYEDDGTHYQLYSFSERVSPDDLEVSPALGTTTAPTIANLSRTALSIIFIPGNAASFRQVRDMYGRYCRMFLGDCFGAVRVALFAVHFNEERTALMSRDNLLKQVDFVRRAISNHVDHTAPIMMIGHSMGGIIARTVQSLDDTVRDRLLGVFAVSTPHNSLPVFASRSLYHHYAWLREQLNILEDSAPLVTMSGGVRDTLIGTHLIHLENQRGLHAVTSAIDGVYMTTDHLCVMWCNQLLFKVGHFLHAVATPTLEEASVDMSVLRNNFLLSFNKLMIVPESLAVEQAPNSELKNGCLSGGMHALQLFGGVCFVFSASDRGFVLVTNAAHRNSFSVVVRGQAAHLEQISYSVVHALPYEVYDATETAPRFAIVVLLDTAIDEESAKATFTLVFRTQAREAVQTWVFGSKHFGLQTVTIPTLSTPFQLHHFAPASRPNAVAAFAPIVGVLGLEWRVLPLRGALSTLSFVPSPVLQAVPLLDQLSSQSPPSLLAVFIHPSISAEDVDFALIATKASWYTELVHYLRQGHVFSVMSFLSFWLFLCSTSVHRHMSNDWLVLLVVSSSFIVVWRSVYAAILFLFAYLLARLYHSFVTFTFSSDKCCRMLFWVGCIPHVVCLALDPVRYSFGASCWIATFLPFFLGAPTDFFYLSQMPLFLFLSCISFVVQSSWIPILLIYPSSVTRVPTFLTDAFLMAMATCVMFLAGDLYAYWIVDVCAIAFGAFTLLRLLCVNHDRI